MGTLGYGGQQFEFEDRLLAHIKVVTVQKLRRRESFLLSWPKGKADGGGRCSLWITDGVPLQFSFHGSRQPVLNRQWVETMIVASHSMHGINLSELPEPPSTVTGTVATA